MVGHHNRWVDARDVWTIDGDVISAFKFPSLGCVPNNNGVVRLPQCCISDVPASNMELTIGKLNTIHVSMVAVINIHPVKPVVNPLALTTGRITGVTGNDSKVIAGVG